MTYIGNTSPSRFSSVPAVQRFSGNNSTTAFTLSTAIGSEQEILVSVDGVIQDTANYTVSGTTLTFSPAPSAGTNNIFVFTLSRAIASVTHPPTSALSATSGTFSGNVSVGGDLDVTGSLDMSDANLTNVGSIQLDSIAGDADTNTTIAFPGSDVITLGTAGSERVRIDASGNVGVGTSSPSSYYAKDLVISSPDEGGITIVQGTGHRGYLAFADGTSGSAQYRGYVSYDHNDDMLYLGTDGGGKLFIDTSGNVLVGTTNANPAEQNVAGIGLLAGNSISVTDDGGAPIQLNRKSSDGSIAIFRRDGSSKGNIGTNGGDLYIAGTTHGLKFDAIDASTMYIRPVNNSGTNLTGQIDLGQSGNVFRDAYVSGGVYFAPNAYPANYLDDYEEGTWTPSLSQPSNRVGTWGSTLVGTYTKVGRKVTVHCSIIGSGMRFSATSGYTAVTGFPFAATQPTNSSPYAGAWTGGSVAYSSGGTVYLYASTSYLHSSNSGQASDGVASIGFCITYFVA